MIELSFNSLFLFYLAATLTIVIALWVFSHFRTRHRLLTTPEKMLCVCEYCLFAYVEETINPLNRCPKCGLYNKENKFNKN